MQKKKYNVAVIGATGSVGQELLNILSERKFPIDNIYAIASNKSLGKEVSLGDKTIKILTFDNIDYKKLDIAFFCTSAEIAKEYIPKFAAENCICIDKSSHYRQNPEVPLIVPEVNGRELGQYKNIIATPNCCVIPLAIVLKPLDEKLGVKRVVISTYQSVSGVGKEGMDELYNQTKSKYIFTTIKPRVFPRPIAFNLFPHIGEFDKEGNSDEEIKIIAELKRTINISMMVSVTCVRVPVFVGHSMAVNIEFANSVSINQVKDILHKQKGINVLTNTAEAKYLTPIEVVGEDFVHVSRIREDNSRENAINLWVACDNLRKGAALNSVQIAQNLMKLT